MDLEDRQETVGAEQETDAETHAQEDASQPENPPKSHDDKD